MSRLNRFAAAVMQSPLLWGSLASLGFFTLIHTGTLGNEFFRRYFAGHWVEYCETIMFFIALSQIILKACELAEQRTRLNKVSFEQTFPLGDAEAEARAMLNKLDELKESDQKAYLGTRLRNALEGICRKGSADGLEGELRFLSDMDAGRAHASHAMVRIIIWAIPILGFLGTVIGITMAIAGLDPKTLESSLPVVTSGLGVAFDTTALALALSMVLMFGQFFVDKQEARLLSLVDDQSLELLSARFPIVGGEHDPQLHGIRKMGEAVVGSVERLVERQVDLWQKSIAEVDSRWREVSTAGAGQVEEGLTKAISRSMSEHRKHLLAAEEATAEQNRKHWLQVQQALEACAASNATQQLELRRTGEALGRIVDSAEQVRKLEEALTSNFSALASSQHLQETLLSLTAAVSLLNSRLETIAQPGLQTGLSHLSARGKAA
ncbi:MAG: MotA/TolQ/ExbB proton channel family protein [Planctomycetales bacterium]|nr:MotA/TolQ/ExbB proton channel family protein [Planctomycetales bacterium]MBN8628433.1 MotA/TolQ/ExbB proton channel family protein [Planctomycetota bacterium]